MVTQLWQIRNSKQIADQTYNSNVSETPYSPWRVLQGQRKGRELRWGGIELSKTEILLTSDGKVLKNLIHKFDIISTLQLSNE